nr:methyltransferase [Paraflavitalea speifideiaquila]
METSSAQPLASPAGEMFELSIAFWRSCCLYTAVRIGVADMLEQGSQTANALASATGCNPDGLYRLLRALAGLGVFREEKERTFSLTPLGTTLTSSNPDSMRSWILCMLGERFVPWGDLLYSVQTGQPSFTKVHGLPVWEYYCLHPQQRSNYIQAMENHTRPVIRNVIATYDFSKFAVVADIGGGNGTLLGSILASAPQSMGILFDQPNVIAAIPEVGDLPALKTRCSIIPGNFLNPCLQEQIVIF